MPNKGGDGSVGGSSRSGTSKGSGGSPGRHVVKDPAEGWDVKKPGQATPTAHRPTQAEAERVAKQQVGREGGGEVTVHRPNGQIRDRDTVAPGHDPNPPKDTKH